MLHILRTDRLREVVLDALLEPQANGPRREPPALLGPLEIVGPEQLLVKAETAVVDDLEHLYHGLVSVLLQGEADLLHDLRGDLYELLAPEHLERESGQTQSKRESSLVLSPVHLFTVGYVVCDVRFCFSFLDIQNS